MKIYKCKDCDKSFEKKKSFSNHIRYGCPNIKKSKIRCKWCKNFMPKRKPSEQGIFCNKICYGNWSSRNRRGKNAPNYVHGKCNGNLLFRSTREYKIWRFEVFKRDNFTCQKCNDSRGGNLQAHHIKPFSLHSKHRLNINNGITLCKKCHKKTKTYGYNKFTQKINSI